MLVVISAVSVCPGQIIYVDCNAPGVNNGSSWTDAYNYLQDALADANSSPKPIEIRVAQGTYTPDSNSVYPEGTGDREASFNLISGVVLKGGYAGFGQPDPNVRDIELYETILSGDLDGNDIDVNDLYDLLDHPTRAENSYHIVFVKDTNETVLNGFTITGGNAHGNDSPHYYYGGGMYSKRSGPIVLNCKFMSNSAYKYGGGVDLDGCNDCSGPLFINCTFIGNSATDGGGLNSDYSSSTIIGCTFIENYVSSYGADSGDGAGIYLYHSNSKIENCHFHANSALVIGGGICNESSSSLHVTNCLFSGNSTGEWGGYGGGIHNALSSAEVISCTFSGNYRAAISEYDCDLTITDTIIWGNTPVEIYSDEPSIRYSNILGGWPGIGNINSDPCFVMPGYWADKNDPNIIVEPDDPNAIWVNGDYHLQSQAGRWEPYSGSWIKDNVTSPCIDAGDMASPIGYEPFPNGGRINMGAYGGTVEASKSYFGAEPCETIIAGDINGDCKVDFVDFAIMALHWQEEY